MKFKWRQVFIALGLVVLIVMIIDLNRRIEELDRLNAQLDTVRAQGTQVMQTQEALVTKVAYASSTQAVEEWAYTEGRWVRTGEKLIGIMPAGNITPTPQPPPVQADQALPNWRIWWELFFGNETK
ncbi:MAG: hypothetical protein ABSB41_09565 [Anaerolineales bacterium]|jgi:cell division protein FtsB